MMDCGKLSGEGQSSSSSSSSFLSSSGVLRLKKIPNAEVMASIQIAVQRTVAALDLEPERDLLIQDFMTFESLTFGSQGSENSFSEFKFHNYAPIAFKYFRRLFQIQTKHFLRSMCSERFRQLENSGSSGSTFFLTNDDEFILKTAQQREGEFLLKLLPGYYLNLTQNPQTLLPKFFGFYCYNTANKNVRIVVMNNLIPSNISIEQKYDLKGSTAKRKATQAELKKAFPTYKDLDFVEHFPEGLLLDPDMYSALTNILQRDCRVLESFKIIDYSLLLAVHHVNKSVRGATEWTRGIPAWTVSGEELLLFLGIIDILQSYQFRKKVEHTLKSIVYEKDSISVHRPDFYSQRFQNFIVQTVFRPMSRRVTTLSSSQGQFEPVDGYSTPSGKQYPLSPLSSSWISCGVKHLKKQQPVAFLMEDNHPLKMATTKKEPTKNVESRGKMDENEMTESYGQRRDAVQTKGVVGRRETKTEDDFLRIAN